MGFDSKEEKGGEMFSEDNCGQKQIFFKQKKQVWKMVSKDKCIFMLEILQS